MTPESIKAAEAEARRFLARVKAWREANALPANYLVHGTKESGALRRASLDLTRSLSAMRKP